MWDIVSCPNRQVCDLLHGSPTAKRLAAFATVREAGIGPKQPRRLASVAAAFGGKTDIKVVGTSCLGSLARRAGQRERTVRPASVILLCLSQ